MTLNDWRYCKQIVTALKDNLCSEAICRSIYKGLTEYVLRLCLLKYVE